MIKKIKVFSIHHDLTGFSENFIEISMRLEGLSNALSLLKRARVKHECNLDACFKLLKDAAQADQISLEALDFCIKTSAKQLRLSVQATPRWKKMMYDIRLDNEGVDRMRALTYRALLPLAHKEYE